LDFSTSPKDFAPKPMRTGVKSYHGLSSRIDLPRIEGYSRDRDPALGTPNQRICSNTVDEASGNKVS
jgi:hypothetical protein